ncbi:hypothetical protein LPJ61_005430, partial [Coemansia biformis]
GQRRETAKPTAMDIHSCAQTVLPQQRRCGGGTPRANPCATRVGCSSSCMVLLGRSASRQTSSRNATARGPRNNSIL